MRIVKLVLENFASIWTALNKHKIIIDLSKMNNKICLIVGPNGSGKTSILSMMHPFADTGNLDVRSTNNLIINDMNGYKEITIVDDNDNTYVIKHYYTHHSGKNHSVKSYIEKNGCEMNVNGNVSSFKEYISSELHIESDYLKLIRLGSNVTSLIGMSVSERKNFMSKMMDDIGVILDYYKTVNTKMRQISTILSMSNNKISKLHIDNIKDFEKEMVEIKAELDINERLYIQNKSNLTSLHDKLNSFTDINVIKDKYTLINNKYKKSKSIINDIKSKDISYYTKRIDIIDDDILKYNDNILSCKSMINTSIDQLNDIEHSIHSYKNDINKINETNIEIERIESEIDKLTTKMNTHKVIVKDFKPQISLDELKDFIVFIKSTQQMLLTVYDFGESVVAKTCSLIKNNINVNDYVNTHIYELDKMRDDNTYNLLNTIKKRFDIRNQTIECCNKCVALEVFEQIKKLVSENDTKISNLESQSFYHDMELVHNSLINILPKFDDHNDVIEKLPEDIRDLFTKDNILDNISSLSCIYDEDKINNLFSLTTEYDNYITTKEKIDEFKKILKSISSISKSSNITNLVDDLRNNANNIKHKISSWQDDISHYSELIEKCQKDKKELEDICETISNYKEISEEYELIKNELDSVTSIKENISNLEKETESIYKSLKRITDRYNDLNVRLSQYKSLSKDIKKLSKIYDEMVLVKNSLSSKEGIPLYFIGNYLKNVENVTNELLDIAYDGNITIDKFELSATEFKIPFFNNGVKVADVKYASQGELSFLSIALSFAISAQSLKKYNIMLLDEVDGPLDTENRWKFIQILENQINRVNSEQSFLITHNSMFSSYPVDIIDMTGSCNKSEYLMGNFIDIETFN